MEPKANDQPREVQIFQSANRPNLLMGGDREMVLLAGLLSAALIFSVATVWAIAVGVGSWAFAVAALSRMAKVDPLLRHVYVRHVRYGRYYPARSGIDAEPMEVPKVWS